MGVRGEIFSTKVILPNRTYFFNVKENRMGDLYLNIVESKNRENGGFDRQSVILFDEDMQEFLKGFDESLRVLEKAVREKRRAKPSVRPSDDFKRPARPSGDFKRSARPSDDFKRPVRPHGDLKRNENYKGNQDRQKHTGEKSGKPRRPEGRKRVVAKK